MPPSAPAVNATESDPLEGVIEVMVGADGVWPKVYRTTTMPEPPSPEMPS